MEAKQESALALQFKASAVVSNETHAAEVTLSEGVVATVYIAELPDAEFRRIVGDKEGYDRAKLLKAAIRDEAGGPLFSKQFPADNLRPKIAAEIEKLVMRHNGFAGDEAEAAGKD